APRGLDPQSLVLRGATVQRLSREQRAAAIRIVASPRNAPAEPPLAPLLAATGASTALGSANEMTDGNPGSTWREGRPGDGGGGCVRMRGRGDGPITRFAIAVAPQEPKANGGAPKSFFLVTDQQSFAVQMPEDAWLHPAAAYDVPLAEPIRTSCVALVLDEAY